MRADGAGAAPEFGYAGNVHPFVEELEVGHGRGVVFGGSWSAGSAAGP